DEPGHRLTPAERRHFTVVALGSAAVIAVALTLWALSGTFTLDAFALALTVLILIVPVAYFGYILLGSHNLTPEERAGTRAYIWLFAAAAVFWMIYDLAPTVLLFFAEDHTDLSLFGVRITAATTQSFNPLFIMLFVPVFAALWVKLGNRVTAPQKFAFALIMVALSFVIMAVAAALAGDGRVSVWWLVPVYLVQVFGELALSPVGLSVTSKLAPQAFKGQMLGVWFIAISIGDAVGGQTGRLREYMSDPAYFLTLAAVAVVAGVLLFLFVPRLRVLMREHDHVPSGSQKI
ncbi:oligopeptide:H+ symporter, partial [Streptosporangium algeriense]